MLRSTIMAARQSVAPQSHSGRCCRKMWFFAWRCGLPTELRRRYDAPILLPADLDLLSQTSPIPAADPEASLYLHGPSRQPDSITIVWRADIDPEKHKDENIRRLVPPRSFEAIELPLWAVRCWL